MYFGSSWGKVENGRSLRPMIKQIEVEVVIFLWRVLITTKNQGKLVYI